MPIWHGYTQHQIANPERPWWRGSIGTARMVRNDGLNIVAATHTTIYGSLGARPVIVGDEGESMPELMARADLQRPMACPPPKCLQVWRLENGDKMTITRVQSGGFIDIGLWTIWLNAVPFEGDWPIAGAVLVTGEGSPWSNTSDPVYEATADDEADDAAVECVILICDGCGDKTDTHALLAVHVEVEPETLCHGVYRHEIFPADASDDEPTTLLTWYAVLAINLDTRDVIGVSAFTEAHPTVMGPIQLVPLFTRRDTDPVGVRRQFEAQYPLVTDWWLPDDTVVDAVAASVATCLCGADWIAQLPNGACRCGPCLTKEHEAILNPHIGTGGLDWTRVTWRQR